MRLTTVILLASLMQVSAAGLAQKISLNRTNASLKTILKDLRSQTSYNFVVDGALLKSAKPVTINVAHIELKDVLAKVFENQDLEFSIENRMVVISKKEQSFVNKLVGRFQTIDVRGRVVDFEGHPLVGASVSMKGVKETTTDKNGNFFLEKVNEKAIIIISYVGYNTKEVSAAESLGDVILSVSESNLDEIQVIAYGTQLKKFSIGNVTTIGTDEIAKQPVTNPLLVLQGRVTGLLVQQQSGVSGSNVKVNIQGFNSLGNAGPPFYVIDGVPYSPQFNSSLADGAFNSVGGSTFNFINPSDVESISVLKDADATAIYGSRAANGAILITTKKGKSGKTKVDVNIQSGSGQPAHKLNLLNSQQYLEMRSEAYMNAGQPVPTSATAPNSSNFDLTVWDQNRNTNWLDQLVGGNAQFTSLQASVSGGSNAMQYLVAYGYNRQSTVYPGNLDDKKGNVHFNLNHNSIDDKFHFNITATYLQGENTLGAFDLMEQAIKLAPNAPTLHNPDGTLNWEPYPTNPARYSFSNPLSYTERRFKGQTNNLMASNGISYEIMTGLQLKGNFGFNRIAGDELLTKPVTSIKPDAFNQTRTANYLNTIISSWSVEPQITYLKETNHGVIDALIGSSFQQVNNRLLSQRGSGYSNDAQLGSLTAAPNLVTDLLDQSQYKYNALFARMNYRYANRYIINLTARKDGSSRFGNENKLHTFYSVGGAWLFAEEFFIKNKLSWLSTGKIRASYGTTGNDQIGDYRYLSLLNPYSVDIPYGQSTGLIQGSIANPFLQWEDTRKINVGLDLGFLNDRINISVSYFRNRSDNQLIGYRLPDITGFGSIDRNLPAIIQNSGLEGIMDVSFVKTKNFTWHSSFNISVQKNKLIKFPNLETSTYADQYTIGLPINTLKVYRYAGVNNMTGLYEFFDSKGEKTSNPDYASDRNTLIDPNPKSFGGFSNSFQYKSLELDLFFQFVNQIAPTSKYGNLPGIGISNQPTSVLRRWRNPGDVTNIQKFSTNFDEVGNPFNAVTLSDAAYSDASYIRLKNVSISYRLPEPWVNKIKLSQARFYLHGQNLLTLTKFIGSDPETVGIGVLPPLKVVTLGVQITL